MPSFSLSLSREERDTKEFVFGGLGKVSWKTIVLWKKGKWENVHLQTLVFPLWDQGSKASAYSCELTHAVQERVVRAVNSVRVAFLYLHRQQHDSCNHTMSSLKTDSPHMRCDPAASKWDVSNKPFECKASVLTLEGLAHTATLASSTYPHHKEKFRAC